MYLLKPTNHIRINIGLVLYLQKKNGECLYSNTFSFYNNKPTTMLDTRFLAIDPSGSRWGLNTEIDIPTPYLDETKTIKSSLSSEKSNPPSIL